MEGGRIRTRDGYERLLTGTDVEIARVVPTASEFSVIEGSHRSPTLPRPGPGRQTGSCERLEKTARVPAPVDCTVVGQTITARRRMTTRRPHCDAFPNADQPGPVGLTTIFVTPPEAIVRLDPPQCARLAFA